MANEHSRKAKRRPWNYQGFDKLPTDGMEARDEWDSKHLPAHDMPPNDFEAWIAATDAPPHVRALGPSVCAWQLRLKGTSSLLVPERWRGRPVESDESKGYVAALAGVLDRLPAGSTVTIYCRAEWIRNAINGTLYEWEENGELDGERAYWRIWRHVLMRIRELSADSAVVKADKPNAEGEEIIERLKQWAREIRPDMKEGR